MNKLLVYLLSVSFYLDFHTLLESGCIYLISTKKRFILCHRYTFKCKLYFFYFVVEWISSFYILHLLSIIFYLDFYILPESSGCIHVISTKEHFILYHRYAFIYKLYFLYFVVEWISCFYIVYNFLSRFSHFAWVRLHSFNFYRKIVSFYVPDSMSPLRKKK